MTNYRFGSSGSTVKKIKDMLLELGYLHASTHDRFGRDTEAAVVAFQKAHGLDADGVVGSQTYPALVKAYSKHIAEQEQQPMPQIVSPAEYPWIEAAIVEAINAALQDETQARREMVKLAMKWAVSPSCSPLRCMYDIGFNLFQTNGELQLASPDAIHKNARRAPSYYTDGREAWQVSYVEGRKQETGAYPPGADCSGKVVGLLRKLKVKGAPVDATAHGFYHGYCTGIKEANMRPGDMAFRRVSSGRIVHTALYLGGGWYAECVGTAYGEQVTENKTRRVRNYKTGKNEAHSKFNVFGTPKFLA